MAGSDFVFNNVKGLVKSYMAFPETNDALIIVLLEATSLEADSTLMDYTALSSILAGTSNEQTTMGRKTVTPGQTTSIVDNANDWYTADITVDITWTAATGNATGKLLICYDPDTTGGTDADLIPLTAHSFDITPDGSDVTAQINAAGFFRAS